MTNEKKETEYCPYCGGIIKEDARYSERGITVTKHCLNYAVGLCFYKEKVKP